MTPEVEAECAEGETGGPACLEAVRKMGRDGWLGIGWPTEYGGQGRTDVEQFIFINEAWRAGAPIPFLSINTVGKTIMEFGSEEQKRLLPAEDPRRRAALLDRLHRAQRGHRPGVAHHQGRQGRRRVGDQRPEDLHVAGQLRRLHLAGRPHRPRRPKHRGITIFLVPTTDPGFSYSKISTMVNASTYNTFYDDVRVGDDAIVYGSTGAGTSSSTSSTTSGCRSGPPACRAVYDEVLAWAQDTKLPTAAA
jgi:3-oxocholest-4-en-26-oyl-CoA dehydrogenase alpha subunit